MSSKPPDQPANPLAGDVRRHARTEFDRWALSYDRSWLNEIVFFPSIRRCQEEILRWRRSSPGATAQKSYRVLDVGCGTGRLLHLLARDDAAERLVGLDYSPTMVRRAVEKLDAPEAAAMSLSQKLHFVVGDSEHLPFADQSFDVLTCCNSFHHYPHQATVVRDFHRVLRPGGLLVLIDGFRDNWIGWLIFDVFVTAAERRVHHASFKRVRDMVNAAGFPVLRQSKLNVFAPLLVTVARRAEVGS